MPEINLLALGAKILTAVVIVVAASRAAERAGAFLGSMIATLPVSTGPVYVFLAIDHGVGFIAEASRMSVASSAAICAFIWAHAHAAQRFGTALSLLCATLAWLGAALLLQLRDWSFAEAFVIYVASYALALRGLRRFAAAGQPPAAPRARFDLVLRALLVAGVVVGTTVAGRVFGPSVTGVLATYPVVFTTLVVILQPRCGGPFTASVLVTGLKGLVGFGFSLVVLHLAASYLSATAALLIALFVAVGWNGVLLLYRRGSAAPGPR